MQNNLGGKAITSHHPHKTRKQPGKINLSPNDYITYLSDLLELIRRSGLGYGIGSQCIPSPTCADDMLALVSNPVDLQGIISLNEYWANAEHYRIHPTKSIITPFNFKESLHHLTENLAVDLNTPCPFWQSTSTKYLSHAHPGLPMVTHEL